MVLFCCVTGGNFFSFFQKNVTFCRGYPYSLQEVISLDFKKSKKHDFDSAYISRSVNNDFEEIYEKYSDMLFRLALSNSSSKEDAEDAVHDVFATVLSGKIVFMNEEHRKAWFIRATVNKCRDILRKNSVRNHAALDEIGDIASEKEEENPIIEALRRLPDKYRTAVTLHYLEGYSVEETAKILNLSVSAIKMRLSRGRLMLREILEKEGL